MTLDSPRNTEDPPAESRGKVNFLRQRLRRTTATLDRYARKNQDLVQLLACASGLMLGITLGSILVTSLPSHGPSKGTAPPLLTSAHAR